MMAQTVSPKSIFVKLKLELIGTCWHAHRISCFQEVSKWKTTNVWWIERRCVLLSLFNHEGSCSNLLDAYCVIWFPSHQSLLVRLLFEGQTRWFAAYYMAFISRSIRFSPVTCSNHFTHFGLDLFEFFGWNDVWLRLLGIKPDSLWFFGML